jgi:N-acetylmuramic acid 6-phosphate etherase
VALANNPGAPLLLEAYHPVLLDTGPEPIAGSTRLGAGTAQKAALNLFSTALMVRLGRVYGNRMLRMRATNRKLKERGARMLKELFGLGEEETLASLERSEDPALALLLALGVEEERARALLEKGVRAALKEVGR